LHLSITHINGFRLTLGALLHYLVTLKIKYATDFYGTGMETVKVTLLSRTLESS